MSAIPFNCPRCGGHDLYVFSCGQWSGTDEAGRRQGGSYEYGICDTCGSRCARYGDHCLVPTDESWQEHVPSEEPTHKQVRKSIESWPFPPAEDDPYSV